MGSSSDASLLPAQYQDDGSPGTFEIADPPYPGLASKYYRREKSFAGEVDHSALLDRLLASSLTGWALCTSPEGLRRLISRCPPDVDVGIWAKPVGPQPGRRRFWECVLVRTSRPRPLATRDFLVALPARSGGTLPGRKPIAYCTWLYALLGMRPGDSLIDTYPGTGIFTRAWAYLSARALGAQSSSSDTFDSEA
ncbi:MAG: hypothetical protein HY791_03025 [Deltaproteobacteria bacterium]|nr:hypothetical protein [Deltaproteobacteria bacterium]